MPKTDNNLIYRNVLLMHNSLLELAEYVNGLHALNSNKLKKTFEVTQLGIYMCIIIIIIKNECHSNITVDRLQGCGHSKKLRESESESRMASRDGRLVSVVRLCCHTISMTDWLTVTMNRSSITLLQSVKARTW